MKTRFAFLLILLGLFLLTHAAFSATWTNTSSNDTFSFTGTTVSTSRYLAGRGTPVYQVTGSADISGTADALGDNTVYNAVLWLMVSGDINSSSFPSKYNINKNRITNGVFHDTYTRGTAKILYTSHPVGKLANSEFDPTQAQRKKSLSDSTSASYVDTDPTSPSGLSASPEVYGSLSGTLMNHAGSKSVIPLTFKSDPNSVTGSDSDDGSGNVVAEKCRRKQLCGKPKTATTDTSHRVACPEERWIWKGIKVFGHRFFPKQQDCEGVWWTCDNRADVCPLTGSHVPASEKSWKQKYVAPDGSVSQYRPSPSYHACGDHETSVSGDHSLQASCSSSNANGNCTVTNFYACQSHTHSYPSSTPVYTPPSSPTPTPTPTPPSSTTVACGGASYTGCSGAPSRTAHHVPLCSNGCGNGYWTCSASAVRNHETSYTCRRCGTSFTRCSNGACSSGYPYHWAR